MCLCGVELLCVCACVCVCVWRESGIGIVNTTTQPSVNHAKWTATWLFENVLNYGPIYCMEKYNVVEGG